MEKPWSDTTVRIEGGIRWSTSGSESECVGQGGVKKKGSRETEVMRSERELKPRARMGEGGRGAGVAVRSRSRWWTGRSGTPHGGTACQYLMTHTRPSDRSPPICRRSTAMQAGLEW